MAARTHDRPFITPEGRLITVALEECECGPKEQRGPLGGTCGACGKAIPNDPGARVSGRWSRRARRG